MSGGAGISFTLCHLPPRHPRTCSGGPFHCLIGTMKRFFVYILASRKNRTLYTSMTNVGITVPASTTTHTIQP
jgi:hypothetical protein